MISAPIGRIFAEIGAPRATPSPESASGALAPSARTERRHRVRAQSALASVSPESVPRVHTLTACPEIVSSGHAPLNL